jgi:hypothetical protein
VAIPVEVIYGRGDTILDYRAHGEVIVAAVPDATLHLIVANQTGALRLRPLDPWDHRFH